jgi:hypothetical protein
VTRWLYLLARRCARNGWLVLGIWLLVAIAVMGAHRIIGGAVGQTYNLPGTDSAAAQDLLNRAFPGSATEPVPVVLHDPEADLAAGPGAASVAGVVSALQDMPVINDVVAPEESGLVSEDGHTAVVQVTIADRSAGSPSVGTDILATARGAAPPSMQVELGGFIGNQVSRPNTRISEALGLLAAVLVLLLTLRRVPAVLIPLVNAMLSVGIGLALIGLLGSLVFIPDVAPTLGTMLGLGVGIDYALFLVVRHRTLLRAGYEVSDAVGRTAARRCRRGVRRRHAHRGGQRPGPDRAVLPGLARRRGGRRSLWPWWRRSRSCRDAGHRRPPRAAAAHARRRRGGRRGPGPHRLGEAGRRRHQPAVALRHRVHRRAAPARRTDAHAHARPQRREHAAARDHRPQGRRPHARGVRCRLDGAPGRREQAMVGGRGAR